MFSTTHSCGHCGNLVDFVFSTIAQCRFVELVDTADLAARSSVRVLAGHRSTDARRLNGYATATCTRCGGPTMIEFTTEDRYFQNIRANLNEEGRLMGGSSLVTVTRVHPPAKEPETDPHWPPELLRQFSDAQRMLDQQMTPSIIIATCRTVLDIASKKLLPGTSEPNLAKRIDLLLHDGVITKPIADWGHTIRLDGNAAVHEGAGQTEEAGEFVGFLKIFLNVTFALPERIKARQITKDVVVAE